MTRVVLASALLAALTVVAPSAAQMPQDFSGTWRMDPSRSESAMHGIQIGPVTVEITQSADEIRLVTTTPRGTATEVFQFVATDRAPATSSPVARWRDDALLLDVVRDVRGQSVTMQQTRRLSPDRSEMTVDSIVNVQHGYTLSGSQTYGSGRDVYVRVTP